MRIVSHAEQLVFLAQSSVFPAAALIAALLVIILLAAILWPDRGVLARFQSSRKLRNRMRAEDALKHFYKAQAEGREVTLESLAGAMAVSLNHAAETISDLQRGNFVALRNGVRLTPSGERYGLNIIRAHRLWEQYLAEQTGISEMEWHRRAEHQEHFISPEQADSLAAGLGHPTHDPHGDPIPNNQGEFAPGSGKPLPSLEAGNWARVIHIEDEPEQVYAQIRIMGLCPGMMVRVLENTAERVRVWCDGQEQILAPIVAANITVTALVEQKFADERHGTVLSHLQPGQRARVLRISKRCRGAERRRLMDLGILPGTILTTEFHSPAGQLTAYRVRDAVIGLRREQAAQIHIEPVAPQPVPHAEGRDQEP